MNNPWDASQNSLEQTGKEVLPACWTILGATLRHRALPKSETRVKPLWFVFLLPGEKSAFDNAFNCQHLTLEGKQITFIILKYCQERKEWQSKHQRDARKPPPHPHHPKRKASNNNKQTNNSELQRQWQWCWVGTDSSQCKRREGRQNNKNNNKREMRELRGGWVAKRKRMVRNRWGGKQWGLTSHRNHIRLIRDGGLRTDNGLTSDRPDSTAQAGWESIGWRGPHRGRESYQLYWLY